MSLLAQLNLSAEERLLLLCARCRLTPEQETELRRLLAEGVLDWGQVWHKARWHDLGPLVGHHLCSLAATGNIPAEAVARFKGEYITNLAFNLYRQAELRRALAALEEAGIRVIALKGAALAGPVYGDIGLRPMSDLDLLTPDAQATAAQEVVQSLGYRPVGTPREQEDTTLHHRHLPGLAGVEKPVLFEIHRHIVRQDSGLYFDLSGFWQRAQVAEIAGRRTLALAPEDLLIHLALNFFLDRRFRSVSALRQLCDVAESARHYQEQIRWPLLLAEVEASQLTGPVGCVLYLAREALAAPVPESALARLWPQGAVEERMTRFARRRVLDTRTWVARGLVEPDQGYNPGRVALAAFRRLIPSREYLARKHHISRLGLKGPLLYLARLGEGLRLLGSNGLRPNELLKEDLALDRWQHSLCRGRRAA